MSLPSSQGSSTTSTLVRAVVEACRSEDGVDPFDGFASSVAEFGDGVVVFLELTDEATVVASRAAAALDRLGAGDLVGAVMAPEGLASIGEGAAVHVLQVPGAIADVFSRLELDVALVLPWAVELPSAPTFDGGALDAGGLDRRRGVVCVGARDPLAVDDIRAALSVAVMARELADRRDWFAGVALGAEAANSARQDELSASEQLIDGIGASLGHEVRDALRSVMGWGRLAVANDLGEGVREEMIRKIQRATEQATAAVGDALELIRDSQSGRHERSAVDLNGIVGWATETLGAQIATNRARVSAPMLPTVIASPTILRLVVLELVRNALEHGGQFVDVVVTASLESEGLQLRVRDNGPGMEPRMREAAFDPGVSTGMGAGYGLTRVRDALTEHGGRIWFDESQVEGVCAVVSLPQTATATHHSDA